MKLVKESLNEKVTLNEKVDELFMEEIQRLRSNVFKKLSDDDLQYFMGKLRDWTIDMVGEKEAKSTWDEVPRAPRGGMGDEDVPDWRGNEMGR